MQERRTPLSAGGGEIRVAGDDALSQVLASAIEAAEGDRDTLTHGFHSYPARMHPAIAAALCEHFGKSGGTLLDPFCGSGTSLVQGLVEGMRVVGADLNPLAIRLARVKTERRDAVSRARLLDLSRAVAAESEERVRARVQTLAKLPREELAWYEPHTLKELAGLWDLIGLVKDSVDDREALEMVFSAIVTKFSRQRADTAQERVDRRIRKGLPTEFFRRKAEELVQRWAELDHAIGAGQVVRRFEHGDTRELAKRLPKSWHADLVITSPPYGGTYDYVDHHARRMAWFGFERHELHAREVGARRHISRDIRGLERWDVQLHESLRAIVECVKPRATILLWMGDGESRGVRIAADEQIERLCERLPLEPVALASQARPDWRNGPPRYEHLMCLIRR